MRLSFPESMDATGESLRIPTVDAEVTVNCAEVSQETQCNKSMGLKVFESLSLQLSDGINRSLHRSRIKFFLENGTTLPSGSNTRTVPRTKGLRNRKFSLR